jgi:hypothetical protein
VRGGDVEGEGEGPVEDLVGYVGLKGRCEGREVVG